MRIPALRRTLGFAMCVCCTAWASESYVIPVSDSVGIYQNEIRHLYEAPIFKVSTDNRLMVVRPGSAHFLVQDEKGRIGWIERRLCTRALRGKTVSGFDPAVVSSEGSPKGFFFIDGVPVLEDDKISLSRSFKEELRTNTDKEEIERETGL